MCDRSNVRVALAFTSTKMMSELALKQGVRQPWAVRVDGNRAFLLEGGRNSLRTVIPVVVPARHMACKLLQCVPPREC